MRPSHLKSVLKGAILAAAILLGASLSSAQTTTVNLVARPTSAVLPDGTTVPMWGYSCASATAVPVSPAPCAALNKSAGAGSWSPVVITVPTGNTLTINLTNSLPVPPGATAGVPTSIMIVGQLGGGLGTNPKYAASPSHDDQPVTWSTPNAPGSIFVPPPQNQRVQSFGTEVETGTTTALTWNSLQAGTYLLESGTHPSIQVPMGLYGILVVTTAPTASAPGTAYGAGNTAVTYNAEVPMLLSEIDPAQNNAVSKAVNTAGFSETAALGIRTGGGVASIKVINPGNPLTPYTATPTVMISGGGASPSGTATAAATIDTTPGDAAYGMVTGITVTSPGTGYTSDPSITIVPAAGDTGSGATAFAALDLEANAASMCSGGAGACYPPAVNYTPMYYMFNGVAFNKTNASASLFPAITGGAATPVSGNVLVRFVNAGSHMHVPSIVGSRILSTNGAAPGNITVTGFSLIAEDGNPLPGVPKVQTDVFMAAGKTYDVMFNVPATGSAALPVYDRELSLSGNGINRDSGMLAYIGINGSAIPSNIPALGGATARADLYNSLVAGQTLTVSDVEKGVIANDTNVFGVNLLAKPTSGTVTLNANGTFTYVPTGTATSDSFSYCANGTVTGSTCSSGITAIVTLGAATVETAGGISVYNRTYTSNMATYLAIKNPGILTSQYDTSNQPNDTDGSGYPLTVATSTIGALTGTGGTGTVNVAPNGGFTASVPGPGTYTFTYQAQNSQGTLSANAATVTLIFPKGSGLVVTVQDGADKTSIPDYRWMIEEDRTFYQNPKCTTNPAPSGCPGATSGVVPIEGVNFATSSMPFVAQGCTGALSCEGGQTVLDNGVPCVAGKPVGCSPTAGQHVAAVCDVGDGVCRPDQSGNGFTAVDPSQVVLDPTKRYYISVLPGDAAQPFINGNTTGNCQYGSSSTGAANCGHGMGGAPISFGQKAVTVLAQPSPFPPGKLSVFVFEDDYPLNGEFDGGGGVDVLAPNEPGLGGFQIHLWDAMGGNGDFTGQMTYDMFNQPLTNSLSGTIDPATGQNACPVSQASDGITGMIVTCPKYEADGTTLSPLAGQAVVDNLMPGRWGVVATPAADRIARGEEWLQTNTLDGQKAHDVFTRIGEPDYFQEYGPANYHVTIGFANPAIINSRLAAVCAGTDPNLTGQGSCNNTITGTVTSQRLSRAPDERLYESGSRDAYYWTQCYVSVGDPDGEDFAFAKCKADGSFSLTGLPAGSWRITTFDQWNDQLVDGLSTPAAVGSPTALCPGAGSTANICNMGNIAATQWQTNLYTRTFIDDNKDGISQSTESGIPFANVAVRLRDGSLENGLVTDFTGTANFNETFPLFSWYTVETDVTRYKNTGTHVVYDAGGPADGSPTCIANVTGYPPCGTSVIGKFLANTVEQVSVPTNLRVPGAVYCAVADCGGKSIQTPVSDPPSNCTITGGTTSSNTGTVTCSTKLSTGRIDPPWAGNGVEGWQGFPGQNNFVEFGKEPYAPGENGGIKGHVVYASTRPFDDPQMLVQTQWEPLIPHVTINLYQEGFASDGVTPTLNLVDTTQTSSWDDYAQGFRADGVTPNMNCPGQTTADLFFFTLQNQPQYLDLYANGEGHTTKLPQSSQFKCYDGMHNWNQIQPAPYDGMYKFPSVTSYDSNGKPLTTNCAICSPNHAVPTSDLYYGVPQLPVGKYVVEVVMPPGYELVKEEDKNILIGDNFIAPVTQEFGGLGNVFIIPDQATVASAYNSNNPQNPTTNLGANPNNGIVPGFIPEPTWPCVGQSRIVPDYISLFPKSTQVAPFAGSTRNLCDRKEVTLGDQMGAIAKFYLYTSTHIASKFTGGITDDFTSEFDPFSPQFGEKFAPPNMPISIKDWTGTEISRTYSDWWGAYDGMTYSTWEVNPPNPTGYSPSMMILCMNDPGTGTTPDPLFNPAYSQFCYELPFMPGTTQYLDTPVVPTSAFSEGYNHPDCAYPTLTPAISEVDGDGIGPWIAGLKGQVTSIKVTNGGAGYTSAPTVTLSGGGGSGATATAVVSGMVSSLTLGTNHGFGYTTNTVAVFTGGGNGSGATASVTLTPDLGSVTVNTQGSNYTSAPSVSFTDTCTTQPTATASLQNRRVFSVKVVNHGAGCTGPITVKFTGGGGSGTTATAVLSNGIGSVTLLTPGSGYSSAPAVSFTFGSGATAAATISSSVVAVNITSAGTGYNAAPKVMFGGGGATATASFEANGTITIHALGDQAVPNYGYAGPSATVAPFNQKTITRHYGFGATQGTGSVILVGADGIPHALTNLSWSDTVITGTVPSGVANCALQQQAQYFGTTAQCGQLYITTGGGKTSIDAVTVTIGGKAPTYVAGNAPMTPAGSGAIQQAIDNAMPGDLIIVPPGIYNEMLLMWKPVRLQGVGAASSVINANTQPAGKLDPWRAQLSCLFGLALNGQPASPSNPFDSTGAFSCGTSTSGSTVTPWFGFNGVLNNPQVDRLPLEGVLGWDTTVNGNLAQLLQEPTLMGAYEGAGITVLSKGVNVPSTATTSYYGSGAESAFPTGTLNLTPGDCTTGPGGANLYPSSFHCNPSSIDGLSVTDSSQGGGGIFVHAWGHNLQIANNRVYNNIGTLSGGINIGQGESPDIYSAGTTSDTDPGSCNIGPNGSSLANAAIGTELPYCFDMNVNMHNNQVTSNTSIGDELFSGTPAGAGGVTICTGADYYKFQFNWICGNMSTGDGGGIAHLGFIYNGDIEHNAVLFNQSLNPTIATNGGGIVVMGAAPDGFNAAGIECGGTIADADCAPGLPDGTGPGLVINANSFMGNAAESGSGGGLRLQSVNGTDVTAFPTTPSKWNAVQITNNIIANNVAGWDGAGISLQDALEVNIVNNTIVSNDTTASSGVLFNTIGAPLASAPGATKQTTTPTSSAPQPSGLVTMANSPNLLAAIGSTRVTCPPNNPNCTKFSNPYIANDIFWQNHAYDIGVGSLSTSYQQNIVTLYNAFTTTAAASQTSTGQCVTGTSIWDIGVRGDNGPGDHGSTFKLAPLYSVLTNPSENGAGANNFLGVNPTVVGQYCNGSRTPPEAAGAGGSGWNVPPGISDATVPNPIFNLSPSATVDEGNNWVNMTWGPLSLINPITNAPLGNYALQQTSTVIDAIPTSATTYAVTPRTDFFGNPRPDPAKTNAFDVGAVEFQGTKIAPASIAPTSLAFGNVVVSSTSAAQTITLTAGVTAMTGINVAVAPSVFTRPAGAAGGTCTATLGAGLPCTINIVFTPTSATASTGTVMITATAGGPVTGSPATLSGTGVAAIKSATLTPTSWTVSQTRNCPGTGLGALACALDPAQAFTLTNTGNVPLTGVAAGVLGGTAANVANYSISALLSNCGNATHTTLAVGATCTVTVQFKPLTLQPTGLKSATISVTDGAGTQISALNGTAR